MSWHWILTHATEGRAYSVSYSMILLHFSPRCVPTCCTSPIKADASCGMWVQSCSLMWSIARPPIYELSPESFSFLSALFPRTSLTEGGLEPSVSLWKIAPILPIRLTQMQANKANVFTWESSWLMTSHNWRHRPLQAGSRLQGRCMETL